MRRSEAASRSARCFSPINIRRVMMNAAGSSTALNNVQATVTGVRPRLRDMSRV